jgi:hypothetical protein
MEERRSNTLMLVTLLHAPGCAQVATSPDHRAPIADATAEPATAPQDLGEAADRGAEGGIDLDGVDGDAPDDSTEDPDADLDADLNADLPPAPDADLPADAPCEAGFDRCGMRVCAAGPCELRAPRPLAPIAALRLHTTRPWFRWELPTGADGVRLEVCATLRCDRVEHTWEVDGARFRPPVALSQGVHFWRLTARRGGLIATVAGPTWAFAVDLTVPTEDTPMAQRDALLDVNGDGVEERVVDPAMPPGGVWAFDLILSGTSPPVRQRFVGGRPSPIGDVNGDGYGDFLVFRRWLSASGGGNLDVYLHLGGRDGSIGAPQHLENADGHFFTDPHARVDPVAVGDVNGDGYGDAYLSWVLSLGVGQLLVGGAERRQVRRDCRFLTSWIGHGDVNADGYEDVITGLLGPGVCHRVFDLLPGGPDADRRVHCGIVPSSSGMTTTHSLPTLVFAHVFDEDGDGYDDVVTIDYGCGPSGRGFSLFRGGPMGIPFTDLGAGP